MYDAAHKKAMYSLANNPVYLKSANNPKKRAKIEAEQACKLFFSVMNLPNFYVYVNNVSEEGGVAQFDPEKEAVEAMGENLPLIYSLEWNVYAAGH